MLSAKVHSQWLRLGWGRDWGRDRAGAEARAELGLGQRRGRGQAGAEAGLGKRQGQELGWGRGRVRAGLGKRQGQGWAGEEAELGLGMRQGQGWGWRRGRGWTGAVVAPSVFIVLSWCLRQKRTRTLETTQLSRLHRALTLSCRLHQSPSLGLSSCRKVGWRGCVQSCSGERLLCCELLHGNQHLITQPAVLGDLPAPPHPPPPHKWHLLLFRKSDGASCGEGTFQEEGMLVGTIERHFPLLLFLRFRPHFLYSLRSTPSP